jgi:CheY-like chemotaxis protein
MAGAAGQYVLVIEDQAPIRSVIRRFLDHHGYKVMSANDGPEALWHLNARTQPSAIVTDYAMPGLSGLEILQQVRLGHTRVPHDLPVVLVSAFTEIAIVQAAQGLDADAVIVKPFSLNCLHQRLVRALAGRTAHHDPAHYAEVELPFQETSEAEAGRASPGVVLSSRATAARSDETTAVAGTAVRMDALKPGMVLAQPVHSRTGKLLASAGMTLEAKHIARIRDLADHLTDSDFIRVES